MHIIAVCPNCSHVLLPKDVAFGTEAMLHCKCSAVYRVSVIELHQGKPVDRNEQRRQLAYTYDNEGNRVPLPDVPGPTTSIK